MEGRVWEEQKSVLHVIHASTHVDKKRMNVSHSHLPCHHIHHTITYTPDQERKLSKMSDTVEMTVQIPQSGHETQQTGKFVFGYHNSFNGRILSPSTIILCPALCLS